MNLLSLILPTKHERDIKKLKPVVKKINTLEHTYRLLDDHELVSKSEELKTLYKNGTKAYDILPDAFALMRESADRRLGILNALSESFNFDRALLKDSENDIYEKALLKWNENEEDENEKRAHVMLPADFYNIVRRIYPESRPPYRMRAFDVQVMGGITLFEGKIAEMKTGEGKTLASTMPSYLRALMGEHVHIVTVNDYLAKRDAQWMGPVYRFLGIDVDCIDQYTPHSPGRIEAYKASVTYGTNNEFGFDYLRDNMVDDISLKVQGSLDFCIVDEVDSVLIDEARTPLIISGPSESNMDKYYQIDKIIPRLKQAKTDEKGKEIPGTGDFTLDEKDRHVLLTEDGVLKVEKMLGIENLYDPNNVSILHHVNQGLRAHKIMRNDVDYIVENGQVVIIDEFTGRKMEGRRFSDGLHQAIEAKERVNIVSENQTLASITFQNFFRMYKAISGMTGTADTEAEEFGKIYGLGVTVIPTNRPLARIDHPDKIYRTEKEKYHAIIAEVRESYKKGQPVLIGTASVEKSEEISKMLRYKGLKHEILNAKNHAREAQIIQKAGFSGSITLATNMAGRGTDIKLGPGVIEAGGLKIVGSERNESRRVDNQLRGRAGRQGDVGESIFFLSMEDELMRRFGATERMSKMMGSMGMQEGEEIQHPWISKAITNAQKKVEGRNFDIRKHLLEYDDVMNTQRKFIYRERDQILSSGELVTKIQEYFKDVIEDQFSSYLNENHDRIDEELYHMCQKWFNGFFDNRFPIDKSAFTSMKPEDIENKLFEFVKESYAKECGKYPPEVVVRVQRSILLNTLDNKWKDHLLQMDHLREGITLRSYGEKKPITEFKREGFAMFEDMIYSMKYETAELLFHVRIKVNQTINHESAYNAMEETRGPEGLAAPENGPKGPVSTRVRKSEGVGRNEPCPCGSGKKYKQCCLKKQA